MLPERHPVFARQLTDGTHTRQLEVDKVAFEGWRVQERRDGAVVRQATYADWRRVELEMNGFNAEAAGLRRQGWHLC